MKKSLSTLLGVSLLGYAQLALAQVPADDFNCTVDGFQTAGNCVAPSGGVGSRTDTRVYTGLVWELGGNQGLVPQVVFGVSSLRVKSNNRLNGGDLSVRIRFDKGFSFDSVRLAYVDGNRSARGNLGLGYSFSFRSLMATAAIQLPYLRAGTDFLFNDKQFKPYVELNTLSKPKRVSSACSRGSLLAWPAETDGYAWNSGTYNESDLFLNGNTCYTDLGPNEGGPG